MRYSDWILISSASAAGSTKILPSPIRPVRAISVMRLRISSTRISSTHKVISTLGRNAVAYLTESLHGAGSPQAQRVQIRRKVDIEEKKDFAKKLSGIKDRD